MGDQGSDGSTTLVVLTILHIMNIGKWKNAMENFIIVNRLSKAGVRLFTEDDENVGPLIAQYLKFCSGCNIENISSIINNFNTKIQIIIQYFQNLVHYKTLQICTLTFEYQ
mgnify:CR=1 FL=1